MELFIMRHGIAVERGAQSFTHDSQRPLTPEGVKRTRKVARAMRALKLQFDLILASPYVRAKQTADIVAEVFEMPGKLRLCARLTPGTKPRELVAEVRRLATPRDRVLLIGHEPDLSRLASLFISGRPDADLILKKAGLLKLDVHELAAARCASLVFLLTPRLLLRDGSQGGV
jgi:phosphohistidine phosphatase